MFNFLSWFSPIPSPPGANLDTRPQEQRDKDKQFVEFVASAEPVNWIEKKTWRSFPIFNQNGSGSCVAQTVAKMLGIMYWLKNNVYVHFSAVHVYQPRSNRPSSGMIGVEALQIATKGVTLEELVPSQNMTDAQMDAIVIPDYKKKVGEVFKLAQEPITLPAGDIDTVASVIQKTGKPVMVWFYFLSKEWTADPYISDTSLSLMEDRALKHSVTAVDFFLLKGKKIVVIEDSWGTGYGKAGQRFINEEFFSKRNWFAAYLMNFQFEEAMSDRPRHTFNRDLKFSSVYAVDSEVVWLQNILKYEGLFPNNVASTGYYGATTAESVLKFQRKYKVASDKELIALGGKVFGPETRKKMNEVYG